MKIRQELFDIIKSDPMKVALFTVMSGAAGQSIEEAVDLVMHTGQGEVIYSMVEEIVNTIQHRWDMVHEILDTMETDITKLNRIFNGSEDGLMDVPECESSETIEKIRIEILLMTAKKPTDMEITMWLNEKPVAYRVTWAVGVIDGAMQVALLINRLTGEGSRDEKPYKQ